MTRLIPIALAVLVAAPLHFGCGKNEEPSFSPPDRSERQTRDNAGAAIGGGERRERPTAPPPEPGGIPAPANVAAPPASATRTASGLSYETLTPGTGDRSPTDSDRVRVHYTGWTTDGNMFDSSVQRGSPATFGVTQVIAGWTEMLKLMRVGQKVRVWIPEELAYGGRPGRPQGMLVFDVELLGIE